MTRLLSSKLSAARQQLFEHVAIPHLGSIKLDIKFAKSKLKADVAHHRSNDSIARQHAALSEVRSENEQRRITIDQATGRIHEQRSVRISVKPNPRIQTLTRNQFLQAFEVKR